MPWEEGFWEEENSMELVDGNGGGDSNWFTTNSLFDGLGRTHNALSLNRGTRMRGGAVSRRGRGGGGRRRRTGNDFH